MTDESDDRDPDAAELRELSRLVNIIECKLRDDCRIGVTIWTLSGRTIELVMEGAVAHDCGTNLSRAGMYAIAARERKMRGGRPQLAGDGDEEEKKPA